MCSTQKPFAVFFLFLLFICCSHLQIFLQNAHLITLLKRLRRLTAQRFCSFFSTQKSISWDYNSTRIMKSTRFFVINIEFSCGVCLCVFCAGSSRLWLAFAWLESLKIPNMFMPTENNAAPQCWWWKTLHLNYYRRSFASVHMHI